MTGAESKDSFSDARVLMVICLGLKTHAKSCDSSSTWSPAYIGANVEYINNTRRTIFNSDIRRFNKYVTCVSSADR